MCFGPIMSGVVFLLGLIVTYRTYKVTGDWAVVGGTFFYLMEFLQMMNYLTINTPLDALWTKLAFAHISYQPVAMQMIFMFFENDPTKRKMFLQFGIPLSFLCGSFYFMRGFVSLDNINMFGTTLNQNCGCLSSIEPFTGGGGVDGGTGFFSYIGDMNHIAWHFGISPPAYVLPHVSFHFICQTLIPIVIQRRVSLINFGSSFNAFCCNLLSINDQAQAAALWCLAAILGIIVFLPVAAYQRGGMKFVKQFFMIIPLDVEKPQNKLRDD